ncbi:metallophosphoesterase family protein [Aquimarina agarilytica]|uniref:metallophosphoesterase family protein n=1 Tax=Aquimarina agarilytica TaxID=1087449 RepID=UPI0005917E13|nr:metallophosphoesterase family protein [Aquimarina agarilytica]
MKRSISKKHNLLLFIIYVIFFQINAQNETWLFKLPDSIPPKDRICFALYTVHENTLKLTAQFYPIKNYEPFEASLQLKENGKWVDKATTKIIYPGYTAPFRIDNWDDTKAYEYRVTHNNTAFYEGTIQKNPIQKDEIVLAAFTCNSIYPKYGGDIERKDIVENMKKLKPDVLFFSGDQVYDHSEHYLYWLKFGRDFGDIIKNTPTICLPDDHDVGQANLWGAGGKKGKARNGESGGYYMPVEYVKEVERAQTSHLPDPYDPTPIEQGIGVYYTDLKWGGISFAILEDRKFKTGLEGYVKDETTYFPKVTDANIDNKPFNVNGATLLGERQLKFLEDWTTDWENAEIKTVLSQTIFAMGNTHSGKYDKPIGLDFDTNGWPQAKRDKALSVIRKSFSCMIAGDQHLGTVIQHGIDDWNDAGYSFCTPSIANFWLRWWSPEKAGANRKKGAPEYTGEFLDGFQNKITMQATANPTIQHKKASGGKLTTTAAGFGVIRYHKNKREITFECWPRNVDITNSTSKQYKGWPITISQFDNYKIDNGYKLPLFKTSKNNQVITVLNETNDVVSSVRIKGSTYQPKTHKKGTYKIVIGEGNTTKEFTFPSLLKNKKVVNVK